MQKRCQAEHTLVGDLEPARGPPLMMPGEQTAAADLQMADAVGPGHQRPDKALKTHQTMPWPDIILSLHKCFHPGAQEPPHRLIAFAR